MTPLEINRLCQWLIDYRDMVTPSSEATNGPPPEPDMEPRDPEISVSARRGGEKLRRELYKRTRTKSADDEARIAAANAKRARKGFSGFPANDKGE